MIIIINFTQNDSYQNYKSCSLGQKVQVTHQNVCSTLKTNIKKTTLVLKSILTKYHVQMPKFLNQNVENILDGRFKEHVW